MVSTALSEKKIISKLSKVNLKHFEGLKIIEKTESTNDLAKLYSKRFLQKNKTFGFFAEEQTQGRGRNQNQWYSPKNKNIYFSLAWAPTVTLAELEGLSLAVGCEISNSLSKLLNQVIKIKWPNDLIIKNKKVGGILIETSTTPDRLQVIIGIGINALMSKKDFYKIDQKVTSLKFHSNKNIDRNEIAGSILNSSINLVKNFPKRGISFYKNKFQSLDILLNNTCMVSQGPKEYVGIGAGIDLNGRLLLKTDKEIKKFSYGVSSVKIID